MVHEFLPLCDVLFNIISLASYFCDVVFDVVTAYTLYAEGQNAWFYVAISCIVTSLIVSQICSFWWMLREVRRGNEPKHCNILLPISVHCVQAGVLLRYFKLFIPVDLRYVKNDVRDLCLLRLIHAFCEAAPMLLLQLYLIWLKPAFSELTDLNIVSTALSLFSVCWALASFNKNVRSHNVHRLVLTWLGVIFQMFWRLGTISSRALALTVYATLYGYWVFLVMALHWVSMFLWLISPKNVFHGEKMPLIKKVMLSTLIAFCYVFCYVNLQEINPRQKMLAFYFTMLLENTLLVSVWLGGLNETPWYQYSVTSLIFISFFLGMVFMILYYQHFHIRKLKRVYEPKETDRMQSCTGCQMGICSLKSHSKDSLGHTNLAVNGDHEFNGTKLGNIDCPSYPLYPSNDSFNVPGVFNCRFNPVIKRKKKKPTRFVPPPLPVGLSLTGNGRFPTPFWKRPLPNPVSSDHESIGSRVNIQQKLQEKKQQQIAELRKIEEEILAGKLKRPPPSDISESGTLRQPIPRAKKQPWMRPEPVSYSYVISDPSGAPPRKPRSQTPEVLLAPHYLENTRIYYEYPEPRWKYTNNYHLTSDDMSGSSLSKRSTKKKKTKCADKRDNKKESQENRDKVIYKSYRIPSDLDSQISLPRSYTLPREFKYYRRPKPRKVLRTDQFLASTNSSDGDVDSCDENEPRLSAPNNGGVLVQPGHPHHHFHHYHHQSTPIAQPVQSSRDLTPNSRPHLPFKGRIHAPPYHRQTVSTHETKL